MYHTLYGYCTTKGQGAMRHNPRLDEFTDALIDAQERIAARIGADFGFGNAAIERGAKLAALALSRSGDGTWAQRYEREYVYAPEPERAMSWAELHCEGDYPYRRPRRQTRHDLPRRKLVPDWMVDYGNGIER